MFCIVCGNENEEGAMFCKACGAKLLKSQSNDLNNNNNQDNSDIDTNKSYTQGKMSNYYSNNEQYNEVLSSKNPDITLGLISMICGILSLLSCSCFGVLGVTAIILGVLQLMSKDGKGYAISGIITGSVSIIMFIVYIIFLYLG